MSTLEDVGAIQTITLLLLEAWKARATDIHLEPRPLSMRVRYRIDGLLTDHRQLTGPLIAAVCTRLKVLSGMDVDEKRLPQEGSFRQKVEGTELVCRVDTFPTEYGEKIALRLLVERREVPSLTEIGMPAAMGEQLLAAARRPSGLVLVTGPTGSGKTTTMYAMLRELERSEIAIFTLEDPVQYRFTGVTQGQTNVRAGFTFASGLRAILRQDPNVIMVGELPDSETASVACTAALTGRMVISSLHTNSVADTFVRLTDIGVERFVLAEALRAVVNQRLVRRLCVHCRRPVATSEADRRALLPYAAPPQMWEPKGCPRCNGTGYLGRVGLFEMVELDEPLAKLLKAGGGRQEFATEFLRRGVKPIHLAGLEAAISGVTTVTEVLRVA